MLNTSMCKFTTSQSRPRAGGDGRRTCNGRGKRFVYVDSETSSDLRGTSDARLVQECEKETKRPGRWEAIQQVSQIEVQVILSQNASGSSHHMQAAEKRVPSKRERHGEARDCDGGPGWEVTSTRGSGGRPRVLRRQPPGLTFLQVVDIDVNPRRSWPHFSSLWTSTSTQ